MRIWELGKLHSTQDELAFIEGLGSWRDIPGKDELLMENYLIAARKRMNWGLVDKKECVRLATHLLSVIRG